MLGQKICFLGLTVFLTFIGKRTLKREWEKKTGIEKEVHTIKPKTWAGQNYDSLTTTGNWMALVRYNTAGS